MFSKSPTLFLALMIAIVNSTAATDLICGDCREVDFAQDFEKLDVDLCSQHASIWCWAAASQMISCSVTNCYDQYEFADDASRPSAVCRGSVCATGYGPSARCLQRSYPGVALKKKKILQRKISRALTWCEIKAEIAAGNRPVAFSWAWEGGKAHSMVVAGIAENPRRLAILDPLPCCRGDHRVFSYHEYEGKSPKKRIHKENVYCVGKNHASCQKLKSSAPSCPDETVEFNFLADKPRAAAEIARRLFLATLGDLVDEGLFSIEELVERLENGEHPGSREINIEEHTQLAKFNFERMYLSQKSVSNPEFSTSTAWRYLEPEGVTVFGVQFRSLILALIEIREISDEAYEWSSYGSPEGALRLALAVEKMSDDPEWQYIYAPELDAAFLASPSWNRTLDISTKCKCGSREFIESSGEAMLRELRQRARVRD